MSEYFIFAGYDTRTLGVEVFEGDTFSAPQRLYEQAEVPGRSGSLLTDMKRYGDITHTYNCVIYQNFENNLQQLRNILASRVGYQRLEDSIHPDEFYKAYYADDFTSFVNPHRDMGHCEINFIRKPQRYLKSGETATTFTENGTITNPTLFPSQPLIRVYGTGRVGIGSDSILITSADEYTDIDCEIMEAFRGTSSCNPYIQLSGIDFPVLKPGNNGITLGTGITRVDITPRWYRL